MGMDFLCQNVRPDLGPNCLKRLSADDNVMYRFNPKSKYIGSTSTCHNHSLDGIRPGQNVGPDLGPNCLQRVCLT